MEYQFDLALKVQVEMSLEAIIKDNLHYLSQVEGRTPEERIENLIEKIWDEDPHYFDASVAYFRKIDATVPHFEQDNLREIKNRINEIIHTSWGRNLMGDMTPLEEAKWALDYYQSQENETLS